MDSYTAETYMVHDKSTEPKLFLHLIFNCKAFIRITTARRLFLYDEIKCLQTCGDILAHSPMHISFNSARYFGILSRILFFSVPQGFSIGVKSGDWHGHWRTLIFLSLNHSRVQFAVSLGSLSCWNVRLRFFEKAPSPTNV